MSAADGGGTRSPTSAIAPSWSVPTGVPSASRAIRPSCGSACPLVIPARSSAAAVHPRVVAVAVGQEDRAIRDDPVEVLAARRRRPESPASDQPPPSIHSASGMGRGVRGDHLEVGVEAARLVEVALQPLEPRGRRMDVAVAEARRHGPAPELDHARRGTDQGMDVAVAADGDDPAVPDGEGLGPGLGGIGREDAAAGEDEIGMGSTWPECRSAGGPGRPGCADRTRPRRAPPAE